MPPEINLNPVLKQYSDFVDRSRDKDVASRLHIVGNDGSYRVVKGANASCGGANGVQSQLANMRSRELFFMGVAKQFGGADKIPETVLKAMYEKDFTRGMGGADEAALKAGFTKGTPLDARHIEKVINAITKATCADRDLFVDNLVKDAWKLLDVPAEEVNQEALTKSLIRLFEGALPPKWESSKHFKKTALQAHFGTEDIRELDGKIKNKIKNMFRFGDDQSYVRGKNSVNQRNEVLKRKVYSWLAALRDVFPSQNYYNRSNDKYAYVEKFRCTFARISGLGSDGRGGVDDKGDYAYDVKFKTDSERISDRGYKFDENKRYLQTESGANDFVKDLLYKVTEGEAGKLCKGDQVKQFGQIAAWLRDKLGLESSWKEMSRFVTEQAETESDKDPFGRTKDLFAGLRGILDAEKNTVGKTKLNAAQAWLDGVIAKVESFGSKKIGTLLWEHGLTTPFKSADLETFDSIAECVYGSGSDEGKNGGAGFVGLFDDGKAFKFLTKWKQRTWIGSGVTNDDKKRISDATNSLRQKLVGLAGKVNASAQSIVNEMLKPKLTNGVDLLSRSDVAKVLDFLSPYLVDENGNKAKWLTLTSATTTSENSFGSLKDVLGALDGGTAARTNDGDGVNVTDEQNTELEGRRDSEPGIPEKADDADRKGDDEGRVSAGGAKPRESDYHSIPSDNEENGNPVAAPEGKANGLQVGQNAKSGGVTRLSIKQLVGCLAPAERDELSKLPFPLNSPKAEKFADIVNGIAAAIAERLESEAAKDAGNYKTCVNTINKALERKDVDGDVSRSMIIRAVVKDLLADKNVMATLGSPKKIDKVVFKALVERQQDAIRRKWAKVADDSNAEEHGFAGDFVRCQTNDEFHMRFTFNGEPTPVGKSGEKVVNNGVDKVAVQNAGLQRMMKEMIPDSKIRSFVTMMCGLEGLSSSVLTLAGQDFKTDYGYGPSSNFFTGPGTIRFSGALHSSNSIKFDLTKDASDLIFTMSVNATPEIKNLLSFRIDGKHCNVASENLVELKMRIPLNQALKGSEMPKFEIFSVSQTIDGESKHVYHPDTGVLESIDLKPPAEEEPKVAEAKVEAKPQVEPQQPQPTVGSATKVYKEFDSDDSYGMHSLGSRIQTAENEMLRALEDTIGTVERKFEKDKVPVEDRPDYRAEVRKIFDDARVLATGYKTSYRKIEKGRYVQSAPSMSFIDVVYNAETVDGRTISDSDRLNFYRLLDQLRHTVGPRIHNLIEEMEDEINDHKGVDDGRFINLWGGVIEQLDNDLAGGIASGGEAKKAFKSFFEAHNEGKKIISGGEKILYKAEKLQKLGKKMIESTLPAMIKRYEKIVETAREFDRLSEKARNALKVDLDNYISDYKLVVKDYGVLKGANDSRQLDGMTVEVGHKTVNVWETVFALTRKLPDPRNPAPDKAWELHQHLPKSFFGSAYSSKSYQSIVHRAKDGTKLKERIIEKARFAGGKLVLASKKMQSPWQDYERTTDEIKELGAGETSGMKALKDTSVKTVNTGIVIGKGKKK